MSSEGKIRSCFGVTRYVAMISQLRLLYAASSETGTPRADTLDKHGTTVGAASDRHLRDGQKRRDSIHASGEPALDNRVRYVTLQATARLQAESDDDSQHEGPNGRGVMARRNE